MPRVYLSPSLQNYNLFINGGSEEEYVNLITDAMEPYLFASGIEFTRNEPEMPLSQVIVDVNTGDYDVFFSIHTTTAPPFLTGKLQGAKVLYYSKNPYGNELARAVVKNIKSLYPVPKKVKVLPSATQKELMQTTPPAVVVALGYNDNIDDAQWIKDNVRYLGRELSRSLAEYFGISFVEPEED